MTSSVQRIPGMPKSKNSNQEKSFNTRQLCFFAAFVLPVTKLLETPALLAKYALGDLLLPAFLHYLLQSSALAALLLTVAKTGKGLFTLIEEKLGNLGSKIFYAAIAIYFLFSSLLPFVELEKFSQVVFFDTAPYAFTFTPFFFLSAFVCVKSLRSFARICDLCFPIFIVAFFGLIFMSAGETDFESVLPWFEFPLSKILTAVKFTTSHFADAIIFLPLLGDYAHEKGAGKKIYLSFWAGAGFVLLFLAVFYGLYTATAPTHHYAFTKIAQYFPALKTVGRIDLILVYLLSVILFFAHVLPVKLCSLCLKKILPTKSAILFPALLNAALFLFVLFFDKRQNALFQTITQTLWWVFPIFSVLLPLACVLLTVLPPQKPTNANHANRANPANQTHSHTLKEGNYAR